MEDFNTIKTLYVPKPNQQTVVTNTTVTPKCTALSLIEYLDRNRPIDKRLLSSSECSQIIRAWDRADWEILIGFIKKYTEDKMSDKVNNNLKSAYGFIEDVEHILYDKPILLVGTRGRELSERETKWFISHYKNTRNDEIQVKLNITYSALHRLARQYGLKKTRKFMKKTQAEATEKARQSWGLSRAKMIMDICKK